MSKKTGSDSILDDRKLTATKAASLTSYAAADFSRLRNAHLGRFTLDRLFKILRALDDGIEVTIQLISRPNGRGPKPDKPEPVRA